MKLTRLYTGDDNESHFEDMGEMIFENKGIMGAFSNKLDATGMFIHEYDTTFQVEWYNPPVGKIYVVFIEGQQQISVGNGDTRIFGYGDILLAEDLTGHGHCTKALSAGKSIILTVA